MNLIDPLTLAAANLLGCLCPEQEFRPYWHIAVGADLRAEYQFRPHCDAHNVGRWWNAMLRLEETIGFGIPAEVEAGVLGHTWRMCANPAGILLDEPDPAEPSTWYIHSYRETMLALGLLVRRRGDERAIRQGLRAIRQMRRASEDLTRWELSRCGGAAAGMPPKTGWGTGACYTHGRAIEGLLCFYEATAEPEALEEAQRIADFHFRHTLKPDGSLAAGAGQHTHSYLNTLRGLTWLASIANDHARLDTLYATYRNAVAGMITPSGFITHDIGARTGGDIAAPGDIAHIAILLWDRFKDSSLLDDAERLVRCRLLPAQVRRPMPVVPLHNRGGDSVRDLPQRFVGAIGGGVGHVKGQTCTTDFTAAVVHSLIEVHRRTVDRDDCTLRVQFHLDHDAADLRVRSARDESGARLSVESRAGKDILIRVPRWAPRPSLRLEVDGRPAALSIRDDYVLVPAGGAVTRAELHFDLPVCDRAEAWRDEDATQEHVVFHWRGDEITGIDPGNDYLNPYPRVCPSFLG